MTLRRGVVPYKIITEHTDGNSVASCANSSCNAPKRIPKRNQFISSGCANVTRLKHMADLTMSARERDPWLLLALGDYAFTLILEYIFHVRHKAARVRENEWKVRGDSREREEFSQLCTALATNLLWRALLAECNNERRRTPPHWPCNGDGNFRIIRCIPVEIALAFTLVSPVRASTIKFSVSVISRFQWSEWLST